MTAPILNYPPAIVSELDEVKFPLFTAISEPSRPLTCGCGHWLHAEDMVSYQERVLRGKPGSIYVKTSCPKCQMVSEHYVKRTV